MKLLALHCVLNQHKDTVLVIGKRVPCTLAACKASAVEHQDCQSRSEESAEFHACSHASFRAISWVLSLRTRRWSGCSSSACFPDHVEDVSHTIWQPARPPLCKEC